MTTTIGERYRVIERLGQGGIGTVYRVEHIHIAKEMAVKVLRPEVSAIVEVQERFEREAQSAAKLDDPRIVRVTDFGKDVDGSLFLVMEYVDGITLAERMREGLTIEATVEIIGELLGALEHAHGNGVIHRDLKPDNVMLVEKDGVIGVKVLDFGLAKMTETTDQPLTQAGMVFGTPRYMSPEQAAADPTDHRSDLYSVGVILYEGIAGRPPFVADSAVDVLRAHISKAPPPLGGRAIALQQIIDRALAKDADDRFQTAAEFREALEQTPLDVTMRVDDTVPRTPVAAKSSAAPKAKSPPAEPPPAAIVEVAPPRFGRALMMIAVGVTVLLIGLAMVGGGGPEGVEAALDRGDVKAARVAVTKLAADHPNDSTTYLALGHVALAEGDPDSALSAFLQALELDNDIAADFRFSNAMLELVKQNKRPAPELVRAVAATGGLGSVPFLASCFQVAPNAAVRRRAYAGLERHESTDAATDPLATLLADLRATSDSDCEIRRWYVGRLVKFEGPRVHNALLAEDARKGPLGLMRVNACMQKELDAQLERTGKAE